MTTQALVTTKDRAYSPDEIQLIKTQIAPGVSDGELQLFLSVSQHLDLDPLKREIYAIARNTNVAGKGQPAKWEKRMTIQIAIDGLLVIAERSNEYEGCTAPEWCGEDGIWRDVWLVGIPKACKIGVRRKGWREPVYAIALMSEYAQDGSMWRDRPAGQLEKCTLAKALKRAFPNEPNVREAIAIADAEYIDDEAPTVEAPPTPQRPAPRAEPRRERYDAGPAMKQATAVQPPTVAEASAALDHSANAGNMVDADPDDVTYPSDEPINHTPPHLEAQTQAQMFTGIIRSIQPNGFTIQAADNRGVQFAYHADWAGVRPDAINVRITLAASGARAPYFVEQIGSIETTTTGATQ